MATIYILILLSAFLLVAYVGAFARRLLLRATGVDITWPLLLLSSALLLVFYAVSLAPRPPGGCYEMEQVETMKSVGFKLALAWGSLAALGFGAAISRNDGLSRFAGFTFPVVILIFFGGLLGLALGDPLLC